MNASSSEGPPSTRRWGGVSTMPAVVFFSALAVHLLHIVHAGWGDALQSAFNRSDAYVYLHKAWYAAFIGADGGFAGRLVPTSPYVWVQTQAYRLLGPHVSMPFLVNAVLVSLGVTFSALTARRLFGARAGWAAGALGALCGPLVFFGGLTVKTNLVVPLLAAGGYVATSHLHEPRSWKVFLATLLLAAASLERHNLILLVLLFAIMAGAAGWRSRGYGAAITSTLAGVLAVGLVAAGGSWDITRAEQRFFSPVGLNFYVGNAPGSRGSYTPVDGVKDDLIGHHTDAVEVAERALGRTLTRAEVSRYWLARSLDYYSQHPGEYLVLQLRKAGMLVAQAARGLPEQYRVWRWRRPALMLALVDFAVLLALAAVGVGLLGRRRREPPVRFLLGSILLYALSVWVFFVGERYRIPLMVMLIPLAAYGASGLVFELAGRRRVRFAIVALLVWGASLALTGLIDYGSGWSRDLEAAARNEERRLDKERKVYALKREAVLEPSPVAWVKLSKAFQRRGFSPDAEVFAEKAIALAPGRALGYERLYRVLAEAGDPSARQRLLVRVRAARAESGIERRRLDAIAARLP
jgi:hypothetical protein